jgi:hypothetical protein
MGNYSIAWLHMLYARANRQHLAGCLMTQKMWKPPIMTLDTINFANLAAADSAIGKLNQNLSNRKCWWQLDLYNFKGSFLLY